ncbi:cytoplasmic membrane protein, partial [mine drainage metagenome]
YAATSTKTGFSLASGQSDQVTTTTTGYDGYGNATSITTTIQNPVTGESATTATANAYTNDTGYWCLGRLTSATVTQSTAAGAMSRSSSYVYGSGKQCVLDSETSEPGIPALAWTKTFTHDTYGNVTEVAVSGPSFATRTTFTSYDPDGRFVVSTTDALGLTTSDTVNALGEDTSITGPNGDAVTKSYDGFGRLTGSAGPWPGASTARTYAWCNGGCADGRAAYAVTTSGPGVPTVTTDYDHHGRVILTERQAYGGNTVDQVTYYDPFGRPYLTTTPYFAGSAPCWVWHRYDARGRVDETVRAADGTQCSSAVVPPPGAPPAGYSDIVSVSRAAGTVTTDDNGRTTVTVTGVRGHVLQETDPMGGITTYGYDALGDLVAQKTPVGAVT